MLDTHVWIWWHSDPDKLSPGARDAIDEAPELGVSTVSAWELATKVRLRKLTLDRDIETWIAQAQSSDRVTFLPITAQIATIAGMLDSAFHGDPADRFIAATALVERSPLVTKDRSLRASGKVACVW